MYFPEEKNMKEKWNGDTNNCHSCIFQNEKRWCKTDCLRTNTSHMGGFTRKMSCDSFKLKKSQYRLLDDGLSCPYCQKGQLRIVEALKIGSYDIICSECMGRWVDEDDVFEMK